MQGSVEALANALDQAVDRRRSGSTSSPAGVGGITETDVNLAKAGGAIIVGFNVRPAGKAQQLAEQEGVEIKLYEIIYDALDDVKKAMAGLLAPIKREKAMGKAEVRQIFTIPKVGTIAGCMVTEGKITRKAQLRAGARLGLSLRGQGRLAAPLQGRRHARSSRASSAVVTSRATTRSRRATSSRRTRSRPSPPTLADAGEAKRVVTGRRGHARDGCDRARDAVLGRGSLAQGEADGFSRGLKDLVRGKSNVSMAEVGENNKWQRAILGVTLVGERPQVRRRRR